MKTASTLQHFVLKDSKIYWIKNYPGEIHNWTGLLLDYPLALQSAIDSAVEVDDVDQLVIKKIYGQDGLVDGLPENFYAWKERAVGKVYSLECSVEKKPDHIRGWTPETGYKNPHYTALVTFPQPEAKTVCGKCKGQGYFSHSNCSACKGSGWIYTQPEAMKEDNNKEAEELAKWRELAECRQFTICNLQSELDRVKEQIQEAIDEVEGEASRSQISDILRKALNPPSLENK